MPVQQLWERSASARLTAAAADPSLLIGDDCDTVKIQRSDPAQ